MVKAKTGRRRFPRGVNKKKQFGVYGRKKSIRQPVHYFKRQFYIPADLTATGGTSLNFVKNYSLVQVPNASEFTNLYDQYKITLIKTRWVPRANSSDVGFQNSLGSLFSVVDYDDSVTSNLDGLMQYQNLKMTRHDRQHVRVWKPRVRIPMGTTGYMSKRGWLDIADTGIEHFGLKGHLQVANSQTITYDCLVTFYMAFKCVR